jgi:hypothetical protein
MAPKFCPNCGTPVEDRAVTACDECGDVFGEDGDEDFDDSFDDLHDVVVPETSASDDGRRQLYTASSRAERSLIRGRHETRVEKKWWEPVVVTLRWVGFIPAGILGGTIAGIVGYLLLGAGSWMSGLPFESPLNRLFAAGFLGYASVFCGAQMAPIDYKAGPAIVMGILMFMVYGIAILMHIGEREWFNIVQSVVGVIAAAACMYRQIEETRPKPA